MISQVTGSDTVTISTIMVNVPMKKSQDDSADSSIKLHPSVKVESTAPEANVCFPIHEHNLRDLF